MTVNGLKLPDAFVALIDRPEPLRYWTPIRGSEGWLFKGGEGGVYWLRKVGQESEVEHGYDWLDGLELIPSLEGLEEATNSLPTDFHLTDMTAEDIAEADAQRSHRPGFIPFRTDFSQVVMFGETGCAEPYCFDYRENPDEPSIIHWDDAYWRRVAANFDTFINLFEPEVSVAQEPEECR